MRRGKRKVFQQWAAIILVVLMSLNLGVVVSASGEGDSSPVLTGLTINGQDGLCTEDSTKISYDSSKITGRTGARTTLYVEGKNLDASQVEARAIDENGIVWPIWTLNNCVGTVRFTVPAGTTGGGNSAQIEMLVPAKVGMSKQFTIQVSIDGGKNFQETPTVKIEVDNPAGELTTDVAAFGLERQDFVDIHTIRVKHVDYQTGDEIAPEDQYQGYGASMLAGLGVKKKEIEGYTLVEGPNVNLTDTNIFVRSLSGSNYTLTYRYVKNGTMIYQDIAPDNWYYDTVRYAFNNGIMTGLNATTFGPNDSLVRAQFALILYRLNGEPEIAYIPKFHDVTPGVWYTDAILWAESEKVVTGYTNGNFGPADKINREQMAVMMYRYAMKKGYDTSVQAALGQYQDASYVSDFAVDAMEWAVGSGIISGKYNQTQLDPQGSATRAECATIMMRFIETFGE